MRIHKSIKMSWRISAALLLVVGVSLSLLGAHAVARNEANASRDALGETSAEIATTLQLAILHEEDLIVGAGGFVVGTPNASNAQFGQWVRSVRALQRYPELLGIAHLVLVPASDLPAFAAGALRDPTGPLGADGTYHVVPPGTRPFYCLAVGGVGRDGQGAFAPGFDFCADPAVGGSALAARDSGVSAYLPIRNGATTYLAVHTPVYRGGRTPATIAGRRAAFLGWLGMSLLPGVVLDRALSGHPHMAVTFRYHAGPSRAVFRAGKAPSDAESTTIDLHNGWTVQTGGAVQGGWILHGWHALGVLIGGIALSVLLCLLEGSRRRRRLAQTEERVLRESEQRLDALLHNSSDMITVVAVDATVLYQAGAVRSVLGHTASQLVGSDLSDWVDPDDVPELLSLCRTPETAGAELNLRHADGSVRTCEVRATSLLDHPAWVGVVLNIRDISQRKRLEVELRLAQKLESVGQLAAGIAHEINTPIQYVSSSMDFLDHAFADLAELQGAYAGLGDAAARAGVDPAALTQIAEAEEVADLPYLRERVPAALERCRDGLERVAKIVSAMRVFGHPSTNETAPVDINAAIENTLVVAASEYKYIADVTADLGDIPLVMSNGGDINQVLINLIVNASHAIADVVGDGGVRGAIDIRTGVENDHVIVTIADTGGGIPAEITDRVFDPFFTTKPVGRGTGQGLAIARSIIDRDGGELTFDTRPGEGTTFTIRLPLTADVAVPAPA
ncbi:MAG: two-component system, NtrC family, sensor kinase [Solirubrobacteraceae bacterium]|jgi:PAS domain S-box-containing protein|nr:two-component system, NtrC family, sensor kinase [Solirubrobacteraceae bacterium]